MSKLTPTPLKRLTDLILEDKRDLSVLLGYTLSVGLISLAVPLTAKAMINTVASGALIQPLIVLSLALLVALSFSGILRALQLWLVETIQARLFARIALRLSERVTHAPMSAWHGVYAPEHVNRFFDVLTIQKSWAKLLVDAPAATVQVLVGMLLMAAYSPLLLSLNMLLALGCVAVGFLGRGALKTSLAESTKKYRVAHWLEDLALCMASIKTNADPGLALKRADALAADYVLARRAHFAVLLRQHAAHYILSALALTGVFATGGWLVISRNLSVGQLVAAEIVVLMTIGAIDKLITLLEPLYDLLTALEKIAAVDDLPAERTGGRKLSEGSAGLALECRALSFSYPDRARLLDNVSVRIAAGSRVSIVGHSGVGKTTLTRLLCGLLEPTDGAVYVDDQPLSGVDLSSLRSAAAIVGEESELFAGSIEENIVLGRAHVNEAEVRRACRDVLLDPILAHLPGGLDYRLVSQGKNLSLGQRQRVLIARALAGKPRLLILDETFTGIGESNKLKILETLFDRAKPWTIVDVSHDPEVVAKSQTVIVLAEGRIVEQGSPQELATRRNSNFSALFPEMARQVRLEPQ